MKLAGVVAETGAVQPLKSRAEYHKLPATPFQDALGASQAPSSVAPASYTIRKGDTLTQVVRDHMKAAGRTPRNDEVYDAVRRVANQNGLRDADRIQPGQVIDLTGIAGSAAPAPAPTASPLPPAPQPRAIAIPQRAVPPLVESKPLAAPPAAVVPPTTPKSPEAPAKAAPATAGDASPYLARAFGRGGPAPNWQQWRDVQALVPDVRYSTRGVRRLRGDDGSLREARVREIDQLLDKYIGPPATSRLLPRGAATTTPGAPNSDDAPWMVAIGGPARVSSGYGMRKDPFTGEDAFHAGIDLAAKNGTDIHPVKPGVVTFSGWQRGYGRTVIVRHDDGAESLYGHNAKNLVRVGQRVDGNSVLGHVGSSGRSTGPHVHLEIRQHGKPVDPAIYFSGSAAVGITAKR